MTGDGQILYVSLLGSNSVARFNMLTQQPDFTVAIPSPNASTTYVLGEIATQPGTENTIALSLDSTGLTAVYDFNTTARTATARTNTASTSYSSSSYTPPSCLRFYDATHLLTHINLPSAYGINAYPVSASGLGTATSTPLLNFGSCFQLSGSLAFSNLGGVTDASTTPARQVGTFTSPFSPSYRFGNVAPDTSIQRTFFLANTPDASNTGNPNGPTFTTKHLSAGIFGLP